MGANVKADPAPSLYDIDFFRWTASAACELRGGRASRADVELIAQEIEDMGKRDAREVWNRTETLLMHLLKWVAQPQKRSRSWSGTIARERRRLERLLKDSPSLLLGRRLFDSLERSIEVMAKDLKLFFQTTAEQT